MVRFLSYINRCRFGSLTFSGSRSVPPSSVNMFLGTLTPVFLTLKVSFSSRRYSLVHESNAKGKYERIWSTWTWLLTKNSKYHSRDSFPTPTNNFVSKDSGGIRILSFRGFHSGVFEHICSKGPYGWCGPLRSWSTVSAQTSTHTEGRHFCRDGRGRKSIVFVYSSSFKEYTTLFFSLFSMIFCTLSLSSFTGLDRVSPEVVVPPCPHHSSLPSAAVDP